MVACYLGELAVPLVADSRASTRTYSKKESVLLPSPSA